MLDTILDGIYSASYFCYGENIIIDTNVMLVAMVACTKKQLQPMGGDELTQACIWAFDMIIRDLIRLHDSILITNIPPHVANLCAERILDPDMKHLFILTLASDIGPLHKMKLDCTSTSSLRLIGYVGWIIREIWRLSEWEIPLYAQREIICRQLRGAHDDVRSMTLVIAGFIFGLIYGRIGADFNCDVYTSLIELLYAHSVQDM